MPLGLNNSSLWVIYLSQKVSEIILYCFTSLTLWSPWQRSLQPWPLRCSGWVTEGDKQVDANLIKLWRGWGGGLRGSLGKQAWGRGQHRLGVVWEPAWGAVWEQARDADWEEVVRPSQMSRVGASLEQAGWAAGFEGIMFVRSTYGYCTL